VDLSVILFSIHIISIFSLICYLLHSFYTLRLPMFSNSYNKIPVSYFSSPVAFPWGPRDYLHKL
jgi:hypothetical protein